MLYAVRAGTDRRGSTIGEWLDAIYLWKWWIVSLVALASGGTWLVSSLVPRWYEGAATLEIEQAAPGEASGPVPMFPARPNMDELVATHIRMLQSDAVLRPVALKHRLAADLGQGPVRLRRLKVVRVPATSLVQIAFRHTDAETAAGVANGIAQSYIGLLNARRSGTLSSWSEASRRQLAELERRARDSARVLFDFQTRTGITDAGGSAASERVVELNAAYAKAQAERAAREAAFRALMSAGKDDRARFVAEAELREARAREAALRESYRRAKKDADAASSQVIEYRLLRQRADADRLLYEELLRKTGEADLDNAFRVSPVKLAEAAQVDRRPVAPNLPLNCAAALMVSLLAGSIAAIVVETRGRRIRRPGDLAPAAGAALVAELPLVKAWKGLDGLAMFCEAAQTPKPGDLDLPYFRERIRMLRNGLLHAAGAPGRQAIAIVSPSAGEGRSRIAAELGSAFAGAGRRTLLIDANLRAPVLHALQFATGPRHGLATALAGECDWRECIMKGETVDVLPSGAPDARSFDLMHAALAGIVRQARAEYECVIIDSPPFLRCPESLDIAHAADTVIAVARAGATHRDALDAMASYLQRLNAPVRAWTLNGALPGFMP